MSRAESAGSVKVACRAMGTRFEVLLYGSDHGFLRAAGEEALREVERLERRLSAFLPESAVSRINREAARRRIPVEPEVFSLLSACRRFFEETAGAFDITLAPLFEAWGMRAARGRRPEAEELARLREIVGMEKLLLDASTRSVRFAREGMRIDLGAVGKGFALDVAAAALREAGVVSALLHGGTSSAVAIGCPAAEEAWKVAVRLPGAGGRDEQRVIFLSDNALSVSAPSGQTFYDGDVERGHLFSPGTGSPIKAGGVAAVICASAARADALSTGLITGGEKLLEQWEECLPGVAAMLVSAEGDGSQRVAAIGFD